jgi:hypothetical protein
MAYFTGLNRCPESLKWLESGVLIHFFFHQKSASSLIDLILTENGCKWFTALARGGAYLCLLKLHEELVVSLGWTTEQSCRVY